MDSEKVFSQLLSDQSVKCLAHPSKSGYVKIASENKNSFGVGQWICDGVKPELDQIGENFSKGLIAIAVELERFVGSSPFSV